ncbi:MAG: tetratricopeptide repeat protein [Nitrososphaeraceae archaeon]|nr:tetratricopeptide repeat protein [Nitrososphaeraceae archaeon]
MNNTDVVNSNSSKRALIIAVSDYDTSSGLKSIGFCKNDGNKMYEILKKNGYDIPDNRKLIGHVDSQKLREIIYDFFTNEYNKPDDTLVFYYSGHGIPDKFGTTFLSPSNIDSEHPFKKGFSFDSLTNCMLACNSLRIVTILDSCFSGSLKLSKGLDSKGGEEATTIIANKSILKQSEKLNQGVGRCLLAASQGYEEAYDTQEKDHSIFTYYLLEGLGGHKNAVDDQGNVTYATLGKFVTREIGNLPPEKRPRQTPVRKGEVTGGDIILASYPDKRKTKETDIFTLHGKADYYYRLGKYQEALECYDSILKIQPNDEYILLHKGNILVQLNKDKKALECFDKVISRNPNTLEPWLYKAQINIKNKNYEAVLSCLDQASNINPHDQRVLNEYKKVKSMMRSLKEKEKQTDIIIFEEKEDKQRQKTDISFVDTLIDKQNQSESVQNRIESDIIIKEEKDKSKEQNNITSKSSDNKPSQDILPTFSKITSDTKTDTTSSGKSENNSLFQDSSHITTKKNAGITKDLERFIQKDISLESDNKENNYFSLDGNGNSKSGRINIKFIIIPVIVVAVIGLILSINFFSAPEPNIENTKTVEPPPTKTIQETERSANDLVETGFALHRQGDDQGAIEYYDKALTIDPNYADALINKGVALHRQGDDQGAIEYFQRALAIDPNYADALYGMGIALHAQGDYQGAIEYYDKALTIDPNYAQAENNKNRALEKLPNKR